MNVRAPVDGSPTASSLPERWPGLLDAAAGWRSDPELAPIAARLFAGRDPETVATAAAEAVVARRLRERGCALRTEIPTPAGRSCDFEVRRDGCVFYLHVKRLRPRWEFTPLLVPDAVRVLERIERPLVVALRWRERLQLPEMRRLLAEAASFIEAAQLGEEMLLRDEAGEELGSCRILAASEGPTVSLVIGLPREFGDALHRVQRLLRKAFAQFMPGAVNVVAIVGESDERRTVETALLGSPAERWDLLPRRGERIALGRADDGFWHGGRFAESHAVAWCRVNAEGELAESSTWFRQIGAPSPPLRGLLSELFGR
ncbi:MAG TPA: hypothetical protein PKC43_04395 [Phycisphaerales bacterium]|nr:hypothetical protein [Phycisphaerales bacterium]HMP36668.1 hypothetical protein [Phycisphaerales bacterium]